MELHPYVIAALAVVGLVGATFLAQIPMPPQVVLSDMRVYGLTYERKNLEGVWLKCHTMTVRYRSQPLRIAGSGGKAWILEEHIWVHFNDSFRPGIYLIYHNGQLIQWTQNRRIRYQASEYVQELSSAEREVFRDIRRFVREVRQGRIFNQKEGKRVNEERIPASRAVRQADLRRPDIKLPDEGPDKDSLRRGGFGSAQERVLRDRPDWPAEDWR